MLPTYEAGLSHRGCATIDRDEVIEPLRGIGQTQSSTLDTPAVRDVMGNLTANKPENQNGDDNSTSSPFSFLAGNNTAG